VGEGTLLNHSKTHCFGKSVPIGAVLEASGALGQGRNRWGLAFGEHGSSEQRRTSARKQIWKLGATHNLFLG
jgi:hypothetical protein